MNKIFILPCAKHPGKSYRSRHNKSCQGLTKTKTLKIKTSKTDTLFEIQNYNVLSLLPLTPLPAIAILGLPPYLNGLIKLTESLMVIQLWYCMP